jgi:hypothetical protein
MTLDDKALNRIIAAAGAKPSHRENLRESILRAEMLFRAGIRQRRQNKSLDRKLISVVKTAKKLQQMLADKVVWQELTLDGSDKGGNEILNGLDWLIIAERPEYRWRPPKSNTRWKLPRVFEKTRSAVDWLAGIELPDIYQRHFRRRPTSWKDANGNIKGAYIDFAEAVLRELGIVPKKRSFVPLTELGRPRSYSRKAIANALDLERAGKSRRRS